MPSSTRKRDNSGKFTSGYEDELESETAPSKMFVSKILPSLKSIFLIMILFFLGLPWSVLFYQPAKEWSSSIVEHLLVYAQDVKGNMCACPLTCELMSAEGGINKEF